MISVGEILRVVVQQEDAPESNRAGRDNTDGSLDLNPEGIPCQVPRAYDSEKNPADQTDSDHKETQANHNGNAELPIPVEGRGTEYDNRY